MIVNRQMTQINIPNFEVLPISGLIITNKGGWCMYKGRNLSFRTVFYSSEKRKLKESVRRQSYSRSGTGDAYGHSNALTI